VRFSDLSRLLRGRTDAEPRQGGGHGGYDDQPRVPAGHPDGGQWTRLSDIGSAPFASSGQDTSAAGWDGSFISGKRPDDLHAVRDTTNFPLVARPRVSSAEFAPWLLAYNWSAALDRAGQRQTIIEFTKDESGAFSFERYQQLTWEEGKDRCTALDSVDDLAKKAAHEVRAALRAIGLPEKQPQFGTAVHVEAAKLIKAKNPGVRTEVSFWNGQIELTEEEYNRLNGDPRASTARPFYGKKGSIRVDVFEKLEDGTICVYDIKTGNAQLSGARIRQIMQAVAKAYGPKAVSRIIITEVKV
jgi:hypothetical protein